MKTESLFTKSFIRAAVVLLSITASAKLLTVLGNKAQVLGLPDPLLGLSNRESLLMVAILELAVVFGLLSRLATPMKGLLAAWLGGNFLLYRLALAILQPGEPCKCLGTLTDQIHLDDRTAGLLLTGISLFLTAGGLWLFVRHRRPFRSDLSDVDPDLGLPEAPLS